ncbi:MAG: MBL fold metallo-hydrolase RNA specificity domain-containing protein [Planctomycetota bacterium]|jgi:metallo-beta-lactamase family protein
MRLRFLGANRQVTGSCSVLEAGGHRVMIDCGLFQEREFLDRNWREPVLPPADLDALLLTHAHLDHTGLVPRLVAGGYDRPIIATEPTVDLAAVIMRDSARIQGEDAAYKKRRHRKEGRRGPHPEVALYSRDDADQAVRQLRGVRFGAPIDVVPGVRATFHEAGHILGAAIIDLEVTEGDTTRRIVFSGDLGQWNKALVVDPTLLATADYVVMESTYGDRNHREEGDIADQLERVVGETVRRGGNVVIPTFAIERAQELLFHFGRLVHEQRIPNVHIFLDSPMAVDVTDLFLRHRAYLDLETRQLLTRADAPLRTHNVRLVRTARKSKQINTHDGPCVIMSTNGMCTAGRIKHHLRQNVERPESTILFVGYQAHGTLGRILLEGAERVRIHGRSWNVRARIAQIHGMSAHADRDDLLRWIGHVNPSPRCVFLNHGEPDAQASLADAIRERTGSEVQIPDFGEDLPLA